jgi:16S rRNA (guanine(966)-N(2))-methyltransferase RsmD
MKINQKTYQNEVRVIGGVLKNSKIKLSKNALLRPTPERLRETCFNWLTHLDVIKKNNFLDLFAGSGVLGIEALSRGAESVFFIEKDKQSYLHLQETLNRFKKTDIGNFQILQQDCFFIEQKNTFNVIFADPPFQLYGEKNPDLIFIKKLSTLLYGLSKPNGLIFLESPFDLVSLIKDFGFTWNVIKTIKIGAVYATLFKVIK